MSTTKRKVDFNAEHAQNVTKEQFIKDHEHHAKDVDLGQTWEDLQIPKSEAAKSAKK